jgi:hypothetical protein
MSAAIVNIETAPGINSLEPPHIEIKQIFYTRHSLPPSDFVSFLWKQAALLLNAALLWSMVLYIHLGEVPQSHGHFSRV